MKAMIYAYGLPGSLTSNDYPIFASDATQPVLYSAYGLATIDNVKMTDDYEQSIILPRFDNWKLANLLCVIPYKDDVLDTSLPLWYWVTDVRKSTITDEAIEMDLSFNAVTTCLRTGDTIRGYWHRCPTNYAYWKGQQVQSGAMETVATIPISPDYLSTASSSTVSARYFWVQITTSVQIITPGTGITNRETAAYMTIYGFPVSIYAFDDQIFTDSSIYEKVYPYINGELSTDNRFPRLDLFLSNPEYYGFTAEEITDISICQIIPYYYDATATSVDGTLSIGWNLRISSSSESTVIEPVITATHGTSTNVRMYCVTTQAPYQRSITGTIDLTQMQRDCGTIGLQDHNGSIIGNIPTAWCLRQVSGSTVLNGLYYRIRVMSDYGQIYYNIGIYNNVSAPDELDAVFQMPGSRLPFLGNAWTSYKAYSKALDRESMHYSIEQANQRTQLQVATQIAGNALSGDARGLANIGLNAVSTAVGQRMSNEASLYNQQLNERRVQAQPATVYSTGDGYSYIQNIMKRAECFAISMPAWLTEEIYNTYINRYGYSVEGYQALTLESGYYEGMLSRNTTADAVTTSKYITGTLYDRLNNTFKNGVRIITIEGST